MFERTQVWVAATSATGCPRGTDQASMIAQDARSGAAGQSRARDFLNKHHENVWLRAAFLHLAVPPIRFSMGYEQPSCHLPGSGSTDHILWRVNASLRRKITGGGRDRFPPTHVVSVSNVLPFRLGPAT
jgi:hypothetical protein